EKAKRKAAQPGRSARPAYTKSQVKATKEPGRYRSGDGLFLLVGKTGARSWVVRVQVNGRRRDIGLGSAEIVTLDKARDAALTVRQQAKAGLDPLLERRRKLAEKPTFEQAARDYYAHKAPTLTNSKHRKQWITSLETYAFPKIGSLRVDHVTEADVKGILLPIWQTKHETARRVRQRIAEVLVDAVSNGHRERVLELAVVNKSLGKRLKRATHHKSMPWQDVPTFISDLRDKDSVGAAALRFAVLTAARSGEVRGMTWGELDQRERVWTLPAERMKAGKPHAVPLCSAAMAVVREARSFRRMGSELVFPGAKRGRPLSDMTLVKVMRDMDLDVTAHGFRSSFRNWAAVHYPAQPDAAEFCLAHGVENAVEAAYFTDTLFDARRVMMDAWGEYCLPNSNLTLGDNIVELADVR
ncbi:MAG: tyrosine-type recombinase/integrase, partial [Parasphingopyxis sp.]